MTYPPCLSNLILALAIIRIATQSLTDNMSVPQFHVDFMAKSRFKTVHSFQVDTLDSCVITANLSTAY